jgi:hypothetical protein
MLSGLFGLNTFLDVGKEPADACNIFWNAARTYEVSNQLPN